MKLIDILPAIITSIYLLIIGLGVFVAYKYDTLRAYVWFVWLCPLAAIVWLNRGEGPLGFGYSELNLPFVLGTTLLSCILGLLFFPVLSLNWRRLSAIQIAGLIACGLVHASPFLYVAAFSTAVAIWGK